MEIPNKDTAPIASIITRALRRQRGALPRLAGQSVGADFTDVYPVKHPAKAEAEEKKIEELEAPLPPLKESSQNVAKPPPEFNQVKDPLQKKAEDKDLRPFKQQRRLI